MQLRAGVSVLVLGLLFGTGGCGPSESASPPPAGREAQRPPNIVLLISDDHGYPDYGFMGSPKVRTPTLDRLAREGVAFSHGYSSASVCQPALATLLTGLEPLQLHLQEQQARRRARLERRELPKGSYAARLETLPRLLAERGYLSFQAGKHWEGSFADAGFDEGMVEEQVGVHPARTQRALVREGLEPVFDFVERNVDRPFFLWFAPLLPHLPHDAPERFVQLYADVDGRTARYYAAISWLDEGIGQLVDRFHALGLEDRTLFVYVADNGWDPSIRPEDRYVLGGPRGKLSLHELGFRTPVILRWSGQIAPQPLRSELVTFGDVFATLLDYAGAALPADRLGHSLRSLVEGRSAWPRSDLAGWVEDTRRDRKQKEVWYRRGGYFWRDARWHYLQPTASSAQLFDLEADPGETRDVLAEHPEVVQRARERIEAYRTLVKPPRARPAPAPPPG